MLYVLPLTAIWLVGCCTSPILHKAGPELLVCETELVSFEIVRARE